MRIACIQMCSGLDIDANIAEAERLVRQAAAGGAEYVQTPEMTNLLAQDRVGLFEQIAGEAEAFAPFAALAGELGIHLHIGSLAVHSGERSAANRSVIFAPDGSVAATYDKIHMFDVEIGDGQDYRESRTYVPGGEAVVVETALGRIGMSVCYDLRFAHLYRALAQAGAGLIAVPSAFTRTTGAAHWQVLIRARAIETGAFVAAAAQGGRHESGRETYGRSIVVGPWGDVLAMDDGDAPGVVTADIDLAEVDKARRRIPALANDRAFTMRMAGGAA